ncbi:hypothetical protein SMACR_03755 [Sordaria macrospora]|uniref:WGS project CABT00000000 data, contig 2.16 n=2 Tax=Sordaria macrospora TaxID=5147 RepID=F7VZV0_SORMK|nr:uncharacterized protein SMAC_03755 [Sordaria macrospora k-hell]KAA8629458.1 hypothetical protein SMACR_03755 [Sordaria macrospora]WPJ61605.1 hypothetical protein SMAC4_03755 [Sordaria macrospora]CCC11049.1 unnamed protein product [Sordaria macrospora k-hell]
MQVCSNFKRFRASLQELLGIKRRKQVKGHDISAPYNFKKETTVLPGITEAELEAYRDKAAASHLDPLRQHSSSASSRSRRGVDRNRNTNKSKSHSQLRGSSSLANLALSTPSSSTTPPPSTSNKRQLGTSKSCLSLNNLPSHSHGQGLQPPRKFSVPNSASSPTVSVSSHHLLGIGGGEMGTGLRPPSPCLSLPIRIGTINGATSGTGSPTTTTTTTTTTTPTSPLGLGFESGSGIGTGRGSKVGGEAQSVRTQNNKEASLINRSGSGGGSFRSSGGGSGGSGSTTPKSSSSPVLQMHQQSQHPAKLQLNTSPSPTTTTSTATETFISAPASATTSEVSAMSAVSAVSPTADLDLFVLGRSQIPISPISPVSPVSPLSLDDDDDDVSQGPKRGASVRRVQRKKAGTMEF